MADYTDIIDTGSRRRGETARGTESKKKGKRKEGSFIFLYTESPNIPSDGVILYYHDFKKLGTGQPRQALSWVLIFGHLTR